MATRGNQRQSMATSGNYWRLLKTSGKQWRQVATIVTQGKPVTINSTPAATMGTEWQWVGNQWQSTVTSSKLLHETLLSGNPSQGHCNLLLTILLADSLLKNTVTFCSCSVATCQKNTVTCLMMVPQWQITQQYGNLSETVCSAVTCSKVMNFKKFPRPEGKSLRTEIWASYQIPLKQFEIVLYTKLKLNIEKAHHVQLKL
jgi:hypothetical protein